MLKFVAVALLGLALANASVFKEEEYQVMFSKYMNLYSKKYSHENFFYRYTVFKANMDKIHLANQQGHSYKLNMNNMGDLTHEEFKQTRLGYRRVDRAHLRAKNACPTGKAPTVVDWRQTGGVSHVKDQGQCGSCWSFSSTGAVEGAVFIASNQSLSLSEQQLIDCSTNQGNQGCNGGLMDDAFQYIITSQGITTEADYPYSGTGPNACAVSTPYAASISGYCDVSSGNENALAYAASKGPVSVAIEADSSVFQFYSSGVLNDASCGTQLDHGVLVVGYNTMASPPYWIVKNSWGPNWGLNGFIYIAKGVAAANQCGIAMEPSYPTGAQYLGPGKSKH